jgi:hypothetical protein
MTRKKPRKMAWKASRRLATGGITGSSAQTLGGGDRTDRPASNMHVLHQLGH